MSHYKPYPTSKATRNEWISAIPATWHFGRLRDFSIAISTGPFGTALGTEHYVSNGIPVINPSNISVDSITPDWSVTVDPETATRLAAWRLQSGDVVTARRGELGRAAVVGEAQQGWICGTGSIRITPNLSRLCGEYVHAWLQSQPARAWLNFQSVGSTMPNLSEELIGDLPMPIPPSVTEQRSLLSALNVESSRIDALIAKKTRFIELLKEKRQALITHAVTKGLDPDAKMKDSGVEWIGDVPAHWNTAQLGKISVARCDGPFGSGLKSEHYTEHGTRVIRLQNIGWAEFKGDDAVFIAPEYWRDDLGGGHEVIPGDVLIAGLGDDKNPLGRACIAPDEIGEAIVKADCYRFRMGHRATPRYVALTLSATSRAECGYLATGATRDRLNLTLASARTIPLPPLEEQREIVRTIGVRMSRIDLLVHSTDRSICLLKERRAALITAAVTGQIDLREIA
jgi:type I restriction enzyme S subunit